MNIYISAGLAVCAALGFSASNALMMQGMKTGDARFLAAGFGALCLSYVAWFPLINMSAASAMVTVSMMTLLLSLGLSVWFVGEPVTWARIVGAAFAIGAIIAFSQPVKNTAVASVLTDTNQPLEGK